MRTYDISPATAHEWLKNSTIYLVDVRELDEYQNTHIPQSHHYPLSQFDPHQFKDQTLPLVIYCRSGGRSAHATELLTQTYPNKKVYNLYGGILEWIKEGFEVEAFS